ncbi:expressed unknown protein [Seminavis robusta]|uniref:Uncharacterized protein n=1 Tax=Seminavis robusta TaxID=568900 RepID=A0A9N8HC37_9STRA|nr:expressed unknown protein [Seminavis robusta]|eukprot:Sro205_g086220.1 n/a (431) ;mRNA; r:36865-38290
MMDDIITAQEEDGIFNTTKTALRILQGGASLNEDAALAKARALVPVFTGGLSLFGCYVVIREILTDHRARKGHSITRLLLSLSLANLVFAIGAMMSTFAAPQELDYNIWGNVGTQVTCELQGFLLVLGFVASPMFYLALSLYYLLTLRYGYSDQTLQLLEVAMHGVPWATAVCAAMLPLPWGMYNHSYETCWVEAYPLDCDHTDVPCQRGQNASEYAHAIAFLPLWPCIIMSLFIMLILFVTTICTHHPDQLARYSETAMLSNQVQHGSVGESTHHHRMIRSVAIQAGCYGGTFLLAYGCFLVVTMLDRLRNRRHDELHFVSFGICLPLQGFLNCAIFMRQREMQTLEGRLWRMSCFWPCVLCSYLYRCFRPDKCPDATNDEVQRQRDVDLRGYTKTRASRVRDVLDNPSQWFTNDSPQQTSKALREWSY